MNDIDLTINYPTAEFTMNDLVSTHPTVAKVTIRAKVNADLNQGVIKVMGKRKVTTGRGRPSVVYSKA